MPYIYQKVQIALKQVMKIKYTTVTTVNNIHSMFESYKIVTSKIDCEEKK